MKSAKYIVAWSLLAAGTVVSGWCQAPQYTITTLAGNGEASSTGDGGPAVNATLNGPRGVTADAYNVYVAEFYGQRVRKIAADGTITTLAGNGIEGYGGDGGPAINAELDGPYRVSLDAAGNLYIADSSNNRIRKVDLSGIITTVAGNGNANYSGDGGLATSASLNYPECTAFDTAGNMYIADESNNVIRKVDTNGIITTVAGNGIADYTGDGGPATQATLNSPVSVAVDAAGDLYISDQINNVIRKVTNGIITTYAGTGAVGFFGDGGPAIDAKMDYPASIGLDAAGNLYLPDINNYRIRVVLTSGIIWTIAGDGGEGYGGDGGPATSASIDAPRSVAVGPSGTGYIGDFGNNRVRMLTPAAMGPPSIGAGGVVSASSFGEFPSVAPGSWIEIYGLNLAVDSREWGTSDFSGENAPFSLDGTAVTIGGENAFVEYINPGQVNVQVPSNVPPGQQPLVLTTQFVSSAAYTLNVVPLSPGLDAPASFKINGIQYVVAVNTDGSFVLPTGAIPGLNAHPAKPGDILTMYGVGFGPVTPDIPAGQIVQQLNTLATSFSMSLGGAPATLTYDGLAPSFMGLYQFDVMVPAIAASNQAPVTFTLGGAGGTQTLYTAVGN